MNKGNSSIIADQYIEELVMDSRIDLKDNSIHLYDYTMDSMEQKFANLFEGFFHCFSKKYSKNKDSQRIRIFWLDSDTPKKDAFANKNSSTGVYYMGLHSGLLNDLNGKVIEKIEYLGINFDTSLLNNIDCNFISLSDEYSEVQKVIINFVLLYNVMHELGHIVCGHQETEEALPHFVHQSKELYAECSSFTVAKAFFEINYPNIDKYTLEKMMEIYFDAVCVFLLIAQDIKGSVERYDYHEELHPHPLVRLLFIKRQLESSSRTDDLSKCVLDFVNQAYDRALTGQRDDFFAGFELDVLSDQNSAMNKAAQIVNDSIFDFTADQLLNFF